MQHADSTMTLISSRATRFYKRVVPCLGLGAVVISAAVLVVDGAARGVLRQLAPVLALLLLVGVFIYVMMRRYLFGLVDEVWDCGESLVVRNKGREERIAWADCAGVSCTRFVNPPNVRLMLRRESEFGNQIAFMPPLKMLEIGQPPIVEELRRKIEAAARA